LPLAGAVADTGASASAAAVESAAVESAPRWHQDLATARQLARREGQLLVVDLYADWCGWCKALERLVFEQPKFQRRAEEDFVLLRVDTDDDGEGTLLKRAYGADTLPTVLLLDPEMAEIGRVTGFAPLEEFLSGLEAAAGSHRELLEMYDRHRDSRDPAVLSTLAKELLRRRDSKRAVPLLETLMELEAGSVERVAVFQALRDEALRWEKLFAASETPAPVAPTPVVPTAMAGGTDAAP
jgi:thioredoxin-related protein